MWCCRTCPPPEQVIRNSSSTIFWNGSQQSHHNHHHHHTTLHWYYTHLTQHNTSQHNTFHCIFHSKYTPTPTWQTTYLCHFIIEFCLKHQPTTIFSLMEITQQSAAKTKVSPSSPSLSKVVVFFLCSKLNYYSSSYLFLFTLCHGNGSLCPT